MSTARFVVAASRGRTRALTVCLALALALGAAGPAGPLGPAPALAQDAGTATIAHSTDGVHLRAEPNYGAEVVATVAAGTVVELRTAEVDTVYDPDGTTRWWPVRADGQDGWVAGFFLDVDAAAPPADAPTGPEPAPAAEPAAEEPAAEAPPADAPASDDELAAGPELGGTTARVASPDGVNLREGPSAGSAALAALAAGDLVELRIAEADTVWAEGTRWWPVRAAGLDGWIAGAYLAPDEGATPTDAPAAPVDPGFAAGAYVAALTDDGTGVNMRADPAPDAERVGFVPEGDVVQVMDGPFFDPTGAAWYLVTDGEVTGFSDGAYFVAADQPPPPEPEPEPEPEPAPRIPEDVPRVPRAGEATGAFIYPVAEYTFTQAYGCSIYWFEPFEAAYGCNFHNGIDLANNAYTPLMAADGGVVEYAGWCDCGLGFYVKIDHGNGFKTVYGHMAEQPWVAGGQAVSQGEVIGPMGSTGNSTGPHVHFMVELNGATVDPLGYL